MTNRRLVVTGLVLLSVSLSARPALSARKGKKAKAKAPPAAAKPAGAQLGKPAPAFTLTDHRGRKVGLGDHKGKIIVLEWINPACPVSLRHHTSRNMETLAEKYARKGVVWLAINSTKSWDTARNKAWATKQKLPYPMLDDQPGDVGRLYGAKTTPDMRIIDKKGVLAYVGAIDDDSKGKSDSPTNHVAAALDELLAGKKVSVSRTRPYGCSVKYAPAAPKTPPFTLTDHQGKKVRLADYRGKIVVLEWINPDCPYSRRHYDNGGMKSLATKYAPKGVVWLAINSTHYWTNEKNKGWVDKHALPYPILNDQSGDVGRAYGAKTTPDMRIIDATGALAYSGAIDDPKGGGPKPVNYVAKALDELLAGKKVSVPQSKPYGCTVKYAKKAK